MILFFYPKASTPGCTVEACNFRDNYAELASKGFEVVGVSSDSIKRQLNFASKQELNYNLIADEDKSIILAFEAWGWKKFMGKEYEGIYRHTYVIDEDGVIEQVLEKGKNQRSDGTNPRTLLIIQILRVILLERALSFETKFYICINSNIFSILRL